MRSPVSRGEYSKSGAATSQSPTGRSGDFLVADRGSGDFLVADRGEQRLSSRRLTGLGDLQAPLDTSHATCFPTTRPFAIVEKMSSGNRPSRRPKSVMISGLGGRHDHQYPLPILPIPDPHACPPPGSWKPGFPPVRRSFSHGAGPWPDGGRRRRHDGDSPVPPHLHRTSRRPPLVGRPGHQGHRPLRGGHRARFQELDPDALARRSSGERLHRQVQSGGAAARDPLPLPPGLWTGQVAVQEFLPRHVHHVGRTRGTGLLQFRPRRLHELHLFPFHRPRFQTTLQRTGQGAGLPGAGCHPGFGAGLLRGSGRQRLLRRPRSGPGHEKAGRKPSISCG